MEKAIGTSFERREYEVGELSEKTLLQNPLEQFSKWFTDANATGMVDPHAMTLSTVDYKGRVSSRIVLMQNFEEGRFTFYSHYESHKGKDLQLNPYVSLLFFWSNLERQVRVEGICEKTSSEVSDAYFAQRPRMSQLAARISPQSKVVPERSWIEKKIQEEDLKFIGKSVPRPDFWGGYSVIPHRIEFWQGRKSRLHDRLLFTRPEGIHDAWEIHRLAP